MLHPGLQRCMQRDPLEYVDGMNHYEYLRTNPTGRQANQECRRKAWDAYDSRIAVIDQTARAGAAALDRGIAVIRKSEKLIAEEFNRRYDLIIDESQT